MREAGIVDQLVALGLTSYEARAYVALIGRDSATAAEAARLSGLPRQRIYDVMSALVAKGLASTRPGRSVKYAAAEPRAAIESLLEEHRSQLSRLEERSAAMIEELTPEFAAGQRRTDPLEYIEVLRDRGAISARFDDLQAAVRREILVFNKPPYATPPQQNVEGLTLARSHLARGIYENSLFDDPESMDGVRRFLAEGEEARFVPELPLKLVIIDESTVMFGMQDPVAGSTDLTIVVVEHPSLATVLKTAFNAYWDRGLTMDEAYDRYLCAQAG